MKQLSLILMLLGLSFSVFSQKNEVDILRLSSAIKTNSAPAPTSPLSREGKKGHDVYLFTFTATENGVINIGTSSFWIKDLTTLPIHFQHDPKLRAMRFKKGDQITVVAEAKGMNPYQKPPKKINGIGLINLLINEEKTYIDIKTILPAEDAD